MSTERTAERADEREAASVKPIVNEFSLVVATVNGSGSQTSNMAIMRALFRMGIPVSGKNLFPSNIQGLPTWFTIRANAAGFLARQEHADILVAMNAATYLEDIGQLVPGGVCFYSDAFSEGLDRTDITYYPRRQDPPATRIRRRTRDYIAYMAYVGIVSQMLGIELEQVGALMTHFQERSLSIEHAHGRRCRRMGTRPSGQDGSLYRPTGCRLRKIPGWQHAAARARSTAGCPFEAVSHHAGLESAEPPAGVSPKLRIDSETGLAPAVVQPKTRWRRWGWPSAPLMGARAMTPRPARAFR
jgi:Pyruvate/2-oxoacid:ferredoxin oxidoreductase gamma subunit